MFFLQPKKNQKTSTSEIFQLTNNKHSFQEYKSEKVFKDKSELCRIAIPYVIDEQQPQKLKRKIVKLHVQMSKAQKKHTKYQFPSKNLKKFNQNFSFQKVPVNQYLNYQLSEQINEHLKQVKQLADEIKHIKQQKRKEVKQVQQKKNKKKNIRIRRTNFKNGIKIFASTGHFK